MRTHITITEKKTHKQKKFPMVNGLFYELEQYTKNMKQGTFLFESQIGRNRPISETQAYRIITNTADILHFDFPVRNSHHAQNLWLSSLPKVP